MQEFKIALKKLKLKSEKCWNIKMIRRLFQGLDGNNDGTISVKELISYLREGQPGSIDTAVKDVEFQSKGAGYFDEDEDDGNLFAKQKSLSDSELYRKVNQILLDLVPMAPRSNPSDHVETVKSATRRFFQRSDPDTRGLVPEERFRAFLRY